MKHPIRNSITVIILSLLAQLAAGDPNVAIIEGRQVCETEFVFDGSYWRPQNGSGV